MTSYQQYTLYVMLEITSSVNLNRNAVHLSVGHILLMDLHTNHGYVVASYMRELAHAPIETI